MKYKSKSLSYTHFKKKTVEKTQKFSKLRDFFLLSSNFDFNFLSFFINTRTFLNSQKILLDHWFVEINAKIFENLNFRAKINFYLDNGAT